MEYKKNERKDGEMRATYKIELTEEEIETILYVLKKYERTARRVIEQTKRMPEGPCFPHTPGTINPWTKATVISLEMGEIENIYEIRKKIREAGYKIPEDGT